jgi:hypothetical protein
MRSVYLSIACLAAFGCGDDNHHHNPDAFAFLDAPADAAIDAAVNLCDYTEAHDATNDYNLTSGFATEQTGIMFSDGSKTICGIMNVGHFNTTNFSIDIDDYTLTLTADADVLVTLTGSLETVSNVGVFAFNTSTMDGAGQGYFLDGHGVFSSHLVAGTYEISVEAYANQDATTAIPYKVKIATDMPATRCPKLPATPSYTEAHDGSGNTDNDMIDVQYTAPPYYTLTASTADNPEPTGLTIAAEANYRVSGSSANVGLSGAYFDKDTYLITTGPTTNQLTIRLNWPSTTADLDYFMFPAGTQNAVQTTSNVSLTEPEFKTMAVKPNTMYWLWVGAFMSSTNLPATYDFSICGEAFTP